MRTSATLAFAAAALVGAAATPATALTVYTTKAAFDAAASTALLEDFEGVAAAQLNTELASFSRNGVTYTGLAGVPFANVYIAGDPVLYPNFGVDIPIVGGTQLTSNVMTANGDEDIRAEFSQGYGALGFDAYYNGRGPLSVTILGFGGVVLGTYDQAEGVNAATGLADIGYLGFVSDAPIWGFRWTTTEGGLKNTGFDNIVVGGTVVPEPITWGLMLVGFGLAGAALRRRRPGLT